MANIGLNKAGEHIHTAGAGSRVVMKDGQVLAASVAGFNPYTNNLQADNRFKTVLELVESVCRENDHDLSGIGAVAAVRAMAKHWDSHLAEGMSPIELFGDMQDMKDRIDRIIGELSTALGLEEPRKAPAVSA